MAKGERELIKSNLTARQLEILQLAFTGKTNKWIAYQLGLSEFTVRNHFQNIYDKLSLPVGRRNKTHAVIKIVREEHCIGLEKALDGNCNIFTRPGGRA